MEGQRAQRRHVLALDARTERLSQSGSPQAGAAAELLGKAVRGVAAAPKRPELAEQYRAEIIGMLCTAKRP